MTYYSNNYRGKGPWSGKSRNYGRKRKSKYTNAEKIAFRMGQEQRIRKSLTGNKDSRVYDAFCKGLSGVPDKSKKKSLFGD